MKGPAHRTGLPADGLAFIARAYRANGRANEPHAEPWLGRCKLQPFDELLVARTSRYLISGLLPRSGLAVVYGPPKCGKSFFIYDAAMHVALGWSYRERRTKSGPVVYCALEGGSGFRTRVQAFRTSKMENGGSSPLFYLVDAPMTLSADHKELIGAVRAQTFSPRRRGG